MSVLKKFIPFIGRYFLDATHKKILSLGIILILAAAIPLTTLVLQNRDATKTQQHAAVSNWCSNDSLGPANADGVCGTNGWGLCRTTNLQGYVLQPKQATGACRGFDDNSGCDYPIITPVPETTGLNRTGQCGPSGYGRCIARSQCNTSDGDHKFDIGSGFLDSACGKYDNSAPADIQKLSSQGNFGCCYPTIVLDNRSGSGVTSCNDSTAGTKVPVSSTSNPGTQACQSAGGTCSSFPDCHDVTSSHASTSLKCDTPDMGTTCCIPGGGTGLDGGATTSSSGETTLGFFDIGPYQCNDVGIRGWACIPGQSTQVMVGFYSKPYDPAQSVEANLQNFIGETKANVSEGDDAAIDGGQFCNDPTQGSTTPTPHRFHMSLTNPKIPGNQHVYGYIELNDGQLHPLGQDGQQYTCPTAAPAANACTNNPVWSTPAIGDTKLVPSSCDANGSFSSLNVSWPAQKNSSGVAATQYVLDWWFTDSNGVYNECNKVVSGTTTTISDADNTSANKAQTSTVHTAHCFVPGAKIGASFRVNAPSVGCYQQHGSPVQACPTTGGGPVSTATHTLLNVTLQLPGIGQGGNLSPKHQQRNMHITLYAADQDPTQPGIKPLFDSKNFTLKYNLTTGFFTNESVDVGNVPTGDYKLLVKVPGYLRKELSDSTSDTSTIHITSQTTTLVPLIKLVPGDVAALFNILDISDFYAIVSCYKDKANSSSCTAGSQITDINDDGTVDGIDINYWLLGFESLQTNGSAQGAGDGIPGD